MSTAPTSSREPKRERGRARVAALLDAAAAVFVEKGYDGTTMTEIAARAATSIGSLYQFFPSKETIADALLARYGERFAAALQAVAARAHALPVAELADALVDLMLDSKTDRAAALVLVDSLGLAEERRRQLRDAMRQNLTAIVRARAPGMSQHKAEAVAIVTQHMLKIVPALVQEEEKAAQEDAASQRHRLVAEAREAIRLYLQQAASETD